jgi:hypothetical protein
LESAAEAGTQGHEKIWRWGVSVSVVLVVGVGLVVSLGLVAGEGLVVSQVIGRARGERATEGVLINEDPPGMTGPFLAKDARLSTPEPSTTAQTCPGSSMP